MNLKRIAFILFYFLMNVALFAQSRSVEGFVTDNNNLPLDEVLVECPYSDVAVKSDNNGYYSIVLPEGCDSLCFTHVGYKISKVRIDGRSEIDITLGLSRVLDLSLQELLQIHVSTVALKEQKITDAPGIVSIITQEDLRNMGIRTVREALTFVPGFAPLQNDDEQILAVRGIFATTNQKILVMRDGHSLNEANLDIPQTEYSLSIDNISKIEIIRGPGASIYGNSALAAVVNIITIDADIQRVRLSLGNYGQVNFEGISGTRMKNGSQVMLFARYSSNKGQSFPVRVNTGAENYQGTYYAAHYPINFDVGFKYKIKQLSSALYVRRHTYKTYWSARGDYTQVDSLLAKPGLSQNSLHTDVVYNPRITEKLNLTFQQYIDYSQLVNYRLLSPIDAVKYTHGRMQLNEWNVAKAGSNVYASFDYSEQGQVFAGIAIEQRAYLYSWLASNTTDSSRIVFSQKPFFPENKEYRGAFYFQAQHRLFSWLKLDAGARYDIAENYNASFNPRVALIYSPTEKITLKTIYTKAFQAPGYSYRTSNADFSGSIDQLQPEILNTFQASVRYEFDRASFLEFSTYYNRLRNLITRMSNNYYTNFGKMASYGFELEWRYNSRLYSVFGNYSFLLPDTTFMDEQFKQQNIFENHFKHYPTHSVNAGIITHFFSYLDASLYAQYASTFHTLDNNTVKQRILLNSTVIVKDVVPNFEFSLSVYNLTNCKYKLGDPSMLPVEQPGCWYLFSIAYGINISSNN